MADSDVQRLFYRNGQVHREVHVLDGQLHGMLRTWHKNGQLATENPYVHGLLHGICRQWSESGELLGSYEMNHGTGIQKQWFDNGRLALELSTVKGEFSGRVRHWLRDGTLLDERFHVENEEVSRDDYAMARLSRPELPEFDDDGQTPLKINDPRELELREHELFIESLLSKPNSVEARKWLSHAEGRRHFLGHFDTESQALAFLNRLYKAGAASAVCADVYKNPESDEFCDHLLVKLPSDPSKRSRIRQTAELTKTIENVVFLPDADIGETYLAFFLE